MNKAITDGIEIEVVASYNLGASRPLNHQFVFSYTVTIKNKNDFAVRLISRYWKIIDAYGNKRIVEGDGIIGKQPVIKEGNAHVYSSWCPLNTEVGSMEGYYLMQRSTDKSMFKVKIPRFTMQENASAN